MEPEIWRPVSDGQVSAEALGLRLIVCKCDTYARYVIIHGTRSDGGCDESMLSSGTEPNLETAMVTAKRVAARIGLMLAERPRSLPDMRDSRIKPARAHIRTEG